MLGLEFRSMARTDVLRAVGRKVLAEFLAKFEVEPMPGGIAVNTNRDKRSAALSARASAAEVIIPAAAVALVCRSIRINAPVSRLLR